MAPHTDFIIGKVRVSRTRLRKFLAYTGCALMGVDAIYGGTIVGHLFPHFDGYCVLCGKYGAALSGASVFFEHEAAQVASAM